MLNFGVLLLFGTLCHTNALREEELMVVVLSQGDIYHSALAQDLKADLLQQSSSLGKEGPKVYLTHEVLHHPGDWTVVPIIPWLLKNIDENISWMIFCEERTRFNLQKLLTVLSQYDPSQEVWIGYGLQDAEPTIVHHFQFAQNPLQYPLLAVGFAMTVPMIRRVIKSPNPSTSSFSKDAMYELALMANHTSMISLPSAFCLKNNHTECATYPLPFYPCGKPVPNEDIFFAVKTCLKYHQERVPVIKKTWGKEAKNIEFFSEVKDESIPTTSVGVVNTDRGHCAKTKAILELSLQRILKMPNVQWLVLADDDTLLSVPRLQEFLSCWPQQPVVVGERYGFQVSQPTGFNYLTGGSGIAFNVAVLPELVHKFDCYLFNAPDDMAIGYLLLHLGISMVHSPHFHQARPKDYPSEYLATQQPISFHKYWEVDPLSVYEKWFSQAMPQISTDIHTEL